MTPEPRPSPDREPLATPSGGPARTGGGGGTTDFRLDALLAAGFLACSAPVAVALDAGSGRCPPDDAAAGVRSPGTRWRDEPVAARHRIANWWSSARDGLLGHPSEPLAPRLLIYEDPPRVRIADDGRAVRCWADLPAEPDRVLPTSVVLLVHGLDETGFIWDDLAPELVAAGFTPVSFEYANDQPIARSADQLAGAMRHLRALGVERLSIVGHSMGGLAARDALTRPGLAAPDGFPRITRLILLASPNRGSALAPLQPLSEVREHIARTIDGVRSPSAGWVHSFGDGDGAAAADLAVGSAYLRELNARGLPGGVPITNITAGLISGDERRRVRDTIRGNLGEVLDSESARALAGYLDGAIELLGDGVVSSDSMQLDGVADTVEVKANHRSMIRRIRLTPNSALSAAAAGAAGGRAEPPPAIPVILDRLKADEQLPERAR